MPMMISPFDHQIISTSGHSPIFEANKPVWIPDAVVTEALAKGAQVVDIDAPTVVAPPEKSDNVDDAAGQFEVALDKAILRILTRNDPADLKTDLFPKANKVTAEMSPDLRRPTSTEISDAYQRLQENISLAE